MSELKIYKRWVVLSLIIFMSVNVLIDYELYRDYQCKLGMLSIIAEDSEQEGIDIVASLLKDNKYESSVGEDILESYGYLGRFENRYFHEYIRKCIIVFLGTVILIIMYLVGLMKIFKQSRDECGELLGQVEECLIQFRNGITDQIECNEESGVISRLNYQIRLMGDYLNMIKEQATLEKQETKRIVSDISHQLKTPVAALDTCFTILSSTELSDDERNEFMERCRNELDGLETLLQSLIQISRMEAGIIELEKKELLLLDTLIMAVNRVYPKALAKDIEVVFEYEKEIEKLIVLQDKRWLGEAFINVLDNAIKYSDEKSEIKVCILERSHFVRIEVKDRGVGIPKEEYHRIFQRFYRGRLKEVKNNSGSGIGLYLARDIIGKHDGTISVSSMFGRTSENNPGSTFVIQIPMVKESLTKV